MDIKEIQARVVKIAQKRAENKKFKFSPELSYIHLTEEVGEVARELSNKQIRPDLYNEENLKEEVVDVILESLVLAYICNIDLDKDIKEKLDNLFKKHGFDED